MIVTLILTIRATKHYVTSFQFLGSAVASKKTINCVWMIVKKLPCTEFERANREDQGIYHKIISYMVQEFIFGKS